MKWLSKLLSIPTWVLMTVFVSLLSNDHELRSDNITLEKWVNGRTLICIIFDINIWVWFLAAIPMVWINSKIIWSDINTFVVWIGNMWCDI